MVDVSRDKNLEKVASQPSATWHCWGGADWLSWGGYLADSPTGVVYHLSEDELLAGGNAGVECAQLYGKELYKIY